MPYRKITLGQAQRQGDDELWIYCLGCRRSARMPLGQIIEQFGAATRLDAIPCRCTQCGARDVDVRSDHDVGPGGRRR